MRTAAAFIFGLFLMTSAAHASMDDELAKGLNVRVDIEEEVVAETPPPPPEAPCADKPGSELKQLFKAAKVTRAAPEIVGEGCKMFRGIASAYGTGDNLMGNLTTSEEPLDRTSKTAAMKFFRYGQTPVTAKVYCGGSAPVEVRVNDRGPVPAGRVIDLSPASAKACGMHPKHGTKPVSVVVCFGKGKKA